jgi:hypothetical protein
MKGNRKMKPLIYISAIMAIYMYFMPIFIAILAPEYFKNEMLFGMLFAIAYLAAMVVLGTVTNRKGS